MSQTNANDNTLRPRRERMGWAKTLRHSVPRSAHRHWQPAPARPEPVALLETTGLDRLLDLVPIRHGRMVASPFTFLRGSAAAMAADLAHTPVSGIQVQLCGDCHLLNFGAFGTPERNLVFDINDFDETLPGPWEWDVKRLTASIVVAGRCNGNTEANCVEAGQAAARSYRVHMHEYSRMSALEIWYARLDSGTLIKLARNRADQRQRRRETAKARVSTVTRVFPRMTEVVEGRRRIVDHPPLIFHLPAGDPLQAQMLAALDHYRGTLQDDRRALLGRYRMVDLAMKVVGVGSVGTRCAAFLMMSADDDPLFLQIKEARSSVLEPFVAKARYQNQGHRVVSGQRLMQATSDMFLGWTGSEGGRNYYFRQLRDMKGGVIVDGMPASGLIDYAVACGWALARAHAKSGDPAAIAGYLGRGETFDVAVAEFAVAYADQTERDHAAMQEAVRSGRLVAQVEETD